MKYCRSSCDPDPPRPLRIPSILPTHHVDIPPLARLALHLIIPHPHSHLLSSRKPSPLYLDVRHDPSRRLLSLTPVRPPRSWPRPMGMVWELKMATHRAHLLNNRAPVARPIDEALGLQTSPPTPIRVQMKIWTSGFASQRNRSSGPMRCKHDEHCTRNKGFRPKKPH